MDIQVESSVVLAAMIAVLLAFIVPSVIRRGQKSTEPSLALAEAPMAATEHPAAADTTAARGTATNETSRPRRNTMATPARSRTAAPQQAPFRIRYDRLGVAAAGALAAVVLVAGAILAPFGVVSGLVPLLAAIVLVASFIGLRALAVRDRRRKVLARMEAVFHEAMHTAPAEPVLRRRTTTVFDARDTGTPAAEQPGTTHERTSAPAAAPAPRTWEPVAVPKPTYVGAAKAERPAPEPLPAPEAKKPQKVTSILAETRLAEQGAALADQAERGEAAGQPRRLPETARRQAPQTGGINLDAVLQRRRA
ncbi:hypothetical protein [Arthrobacter sp.]|uniref:hypothetical protein n=1 Tax=Arthrobacter sp. TaxID=1667 RepID=UPI003A8F2FD2